MVERSRVKEKEMPKAVMKKASESAAAGKIRAAIGASPDEEIHVTTPQFEREPGRPGPASPPTDWESLKMLDAQALKELGLRPWGCPEDSDGVERTEQGCLWLFPGEWYSTIPAGLKVVTILFEDKMFISGETDDDIRFGCLSFGFMGPALPAKQEKK